MVKKIISFALVMAMMLSLVACTGGKTAKEQAETPSQGSSTQGTAEKQYKKNIVIGVDTEAVSLDTHSDADTASLIADNLCYDTLIFRDMETGEYSGGLAESWEFLDDVTLKLNLRKGVIFGDGNEMTSDDIEFSIRRQQELLRSADEISGIKEIEKPDAYTVIFHLEAPDVVLINSLSRDVCSIQSKHCMDTGTWQHISTGPFAMTSWSSGDEVVFTRRPEYWQGCPKTESITLRYIPEASSRIIALENGEIDICQKVAANDVSKITDHKELKVYEAPSAGVEYVVLNCAHAPFNDVKVRQAISCATNREALVQGVLKGEGVVCNTMIGPGVTYHSDNLEAYQYNYDVEKAKALLAEAGYANGFKFTMLVKGSQQKLTAEILQDQYKEIGVELDIQFAENTAFFDALNRGDFDAGMITLSNSSMEPANQCDKLYGPNVGSAGNRGRWQNDEYDKLYVDSSSETDFAKRGEMFERMQQIVVTENPFILMMCANLYTGSVAELEGFSQPPTNTIKYRTIYIPLN